MIFRYISDLTAKSLTFGCESSILRKDINETYGEGRRLVLVDGDTAMQWLAVEDWKAQGGEFKTSIRNNRAVRQG